MGKVLVIRKTDKTVHIVPMSNKPALLAYIKRQKNGWKVEEMDEKDSEKLSFIDENYVTPAEAVVKVDKLQSELDATTKELEELRAAFAEKQKKGANSEKSVTKA